uniref:ubiquitinyl hydrolase 1 n=1 Tax=Aceria tosichella TaxID=561515 RepID=A0A6G1S6X5_9ACAR
MSDADGIIKQEEAIEHNQALVELKYDEIVVEDNKPIVKSLKDCVVDTADGECPFFDTIDRKALDFDFEKVCSVSLSKVNVYACLVCGKYFTGRKENTYAFTHSINESHHVFLNLETHKFYCLPDNYEIKHPSLNDILHVLKPTFTPEEIANLDKNDKMVQAYDGKSYYPGIVGLNNLKFNDYCNVIFQALSHVIPLRNYFLSNPAGSTTSNRVDERYLLSHRFGELLRKLWNPRNFKAHVSPHEMLQAIVLTSKKKFEFTKQSDPIVFLGWFLDSLLGPKRTKNSIIEQTLQGDMRIYSRLLLPNVNSPSANTDDPELIPATEEEFDITSFQYLTLDLPSMPLFPKKDEKGRVIKPRVSVYDLLNKYDSKTQHEFRSYKESAIKRYEILRLPQYLILYYKRFTKNTFFIEKNTHIVDFPINNLNLTHLLKGFEPEKDQDDSKDMSTDDPTIQKQYIYRLVANIVHDGEPDAGKGTYRAHILHRGTGKWFEMQDLYVTEMADTMLITLSESYIQVWELKADTT